MKVVEKAILSTDMAMYFKKKNTFLQLSDNGEFDWQSQDKKDRKLKEIVFCNIQICHVCSNCIATLFGDYILYY